MLRISRNGLARVAVLALAWGLVQTGVASPVHAQSSWYDAEALLGHLRSGQREGLERQLGVRSLEQLTLYALHVTLADALDSFELREEVYFTNPEDRPLSELQLVVPVNQAAPQVEFVSGRCVDSECRVEADAAGRIVLGLATPLAPGGRVRVELGLRGRLEQIAPGRTTMLAQGMESLGALGGSADRQSYGLLAQGDGISTLASFYAVVAPREDGRWRGSSGARVGDLASDAVSNVRLTVSVPRDTRVVATGVELHSLPVLASAMGAPRREVTFAAGLVREAGLVVGNTLTSSMRLANGVMVRAWYLPGERAAGGRTLDVACSALEFYERRFGEYPYSELDVVEAPLVGGAGGVELSAMVLVASMMYRGASGGAGGGAMDDLLVAMLEHVTAHEVAHQWWHGLVGSDSERHPWIDESLAQWSAILWFEERYGAARAQLEAERQVGMNYRAMRLSGVGDGAVDRSVDGFDSSLNYAGLVYGKGPFFYREVRRVLGDEAFYAGLADYVRRDRFRLSDGPVGALARAGHAGEIRRLARRWLQEARGDEDLQLGDASSMLHDLLRSELGLNLDGQPELERLLEQMVRGALSGQAAGEGELGRLLESAGGGEALERLLGTVGSSALAGGARGSGDALGGTSQGSGSSPVSGLRRQDLAGGSGLQALEDLLRGSAEAEELLRSLPH